MSKKSLKAIEQPQLPVDVPFTEGTPPEQPAVPEGTSVPATEVRSREEVFMGIVVESY